MLTQARLNDISYATIGAAIEVHRQMGPGFLEGIYQECMVIELRARGLSVETELAIPIIYKGQQLRRRHRCDLTVEDCILVELKSVERLIPLNDAQILSYLRLTGKPKGLLINFNSEVIKDSIKSFVTAAFSRLPLR